jgi:hypothetical protein
MARMALGNPVFVKPWSTACWAMLLKRNLPCSFGGVSVNSAFSRAGALNSWIIAAILLFHGAPLGKSLSCPVISFANPWITQLTQALPGHRGHLSHLGHLGRAQRTPLPTEQSKLPGGVVAFKGGHGFFLQNLMRPYKRHEKKGFSS